MLVTQLPEPLSERLGVAFSVAERLKFFQQRERLVVLAGFLGVDQCADLPPSLFSTRRQPVQALFVRCRRRPRLASVFPRGSLGLSPFSLLTQRPCRLPDFTGRASPRL
ncbi:hypothetical protein [Actinomadura sp. DC4]|uniref:hypothetical protein n=1 Tax=Actinomadura sp. DC4 TaxID=3055069 RepID=UPI0025AFCDE6|nr:hypothetical protein [Actinomadura sp. DC4]MDN3351357.1 hypothetical protein [Actinomadura sp. DC4]